MKTFSLLAATAFVVAAGAALAQPPAGARPDRNADVTRQQVIDRVDQRFARMDANNDGRLTPEEARAMHEQRRTEMANRMFERLDANRDGSVSRVEFDQARASRAERRAERMAGREGGPLMGMRMHRRGHSMRGPGGRGMRGMRMFGEQGFVTREQMRERALARFDRLDADSNGTLTAAERRQGREQMRERIRERREMRRPGA
ncbi:MAG: EF-hand domain-containing protein [Sphingosinicella sp.]|uniref:EF-hand domain-containing protein n=1 Tax=Sphingosinicella sp. TaxID=1917971 RepID=UPI004037EBC2